LTKTKSYQIKLTEPRMISLHDKFSRNFSVQKFLLKQQKYNQDVAIRFFIVNKIKNNIEHKVALIAIADFKVIANGMFSDS